MDLLQIEFANAAHARQEGHQLELDAHPVAPFAFAKQQFLIGQNDLSHGLDRVQPNGELDCRLRSEEHTSELQSLAYLVCRLLLEKKKQHHYCIRDAVTAEHNLPPHLSAPAPPASH